MARIASDDRIASGGADRAASVDLPDPAAPTRTTRHGSGSWMTPLRSGRLAPRLPAATLAWPHVISRLVVDRRTSDDMAVLELVARRVPRALDRAVDKGSLGERATGVGAGVVEGEDPLALADEDELVDPE